MYLLAEEFANTAARQARTVGAEEWVSPGPGAGCRLGPIPWWPGASVWNLQPVVTLKAVQA